MPRRLLRSERTAYRRDDLFMARIREATTWKTRLDAGVDYLKAALENQPETADQTAEEAALHLADLARTITFGRTGGNP